MTPEAEELLRAGRAVLQPSDADRERVFQSLRSELAGPAGKEDEVADLSRAPAVTTGTLVKAGSVIVGLAVAGGGLFWLLRSDHPRSDAAAALGPAVPALIPHVTPPAEAETRAPPSPADVPATAEERPASPAERSAARATFVPAEPRAARRASAARPAQDPLAREVALLSQASAELYGGRFAAALERLAEHERRFPRGVLAQERSAAKARALCGLGRIEEGQLELDRLAQTGSGSLLEKRAAQVCSAARAERK